MEAQGAWLGESDGASSTCFGGVHMRPQSTSIVRAFTYTHSQPQWTDYDEDYLDAVALAGPANFSQHFACHPQRLGRARTCLICHKTNARCDCKRCSVCECTVRMGTRHHCRACDRPVCDGCRSRRRCMRVGATAELVCDMCAVYWGLANVSCYRGPTEVGVLRWGIYALQSVAEMPRLCMMSACQTLTYHKQCYMCQAPTVVTRHHKRRYVALASTTDSIAEHVRMLDLTVQQARSKAVDALTEQDVNRAFSRCFPARQECTAFAGLRSKHESRALLLAVEAANIAYEYCNAPSITLNMSDLPYASLLKVTASTSRYTVLQAPGKLLIIAFPGTHNLRTSLVDMKIGQTNVVVWKDIVDGVVVQRDTHGVTQAGADAAATVEPSVRFVHGGMRRMWEYSIHNGFQREASQVDVPIPLLMSKLRAGYRIVLCGHSLGGAVAQLITMRLLEACQRSEPHSTQTSITSRSPATKNAQTFTTHGEGDSANRSSQLTDEGGVACALGAKRPSRSGHAAVSACATATHSIDHDDDDDDSADESDITSRVMCVAIGTPMMGDYRLADYVEKQGWCRHFHALVYRNDIVPRLGCADQIALNALSNMYGRMLDTFMGVQSWLRWPLWGRAVSRPEGVSQDSPGEHGGNACASEATANTVRATDAVSCACAEPAITDEERARMAQGILLTRSDDMAEEMDDASREILEKDEEIVSFVDESIRHSRDDVEQSRGGDEEYPSSHLTSAARAVTHVATPASPKQVVSRRYACFGHVHFLGYGPAGYRTTGDAELAFGLLREGSGGSTSVHDHSMTAYNRGVLFHVLGTKC